MRWSRLRQLIDNIIAPDLALEFRCTRYRRPSGPEFGRYCVILNGETVWAEPSDLHEEMKGSEVNAVASEITAAIREYLDTPREELMTKKLEGDRWGLGDILRSSDRRLGVRSLEKLSERELCSAARKILSERLGRRENC